MFKLFFLYIRFVYVLTHEHVPQMNTLYLTPTQSILRYVTTTLCTCKTVQSPHTSLVLIFYIATISKKQQQRITFNRCIVYPRQREQTSVAVYVIWARVEFALFCCSVKKWTQSIVCVTSSWQFVIL